MVGVAFGEFAVEPREYAINLAEEITLTVTVSWERSRDAEAGEIRCTWLQRDGEL